MKVISRRDLASYKQRCTFIVGIFFTLYVLVVMRLFIVQVYQHDFFVKQAERQYHFDITSLAPRAPIFDRHGVLLADNLPVLSAFIAPHQCGSQTKLHDFLKTYYPDVYAKVLEFPTKNFFWLERKLTDTQVQSLKERAMKCGVKEIWFLDELRRFYPYAELLPIIGLTDIDNEGIAGIELLCSSILRGEGTVATAQKEGRFSKLYFDHVVKRKGHSGKSVMLTIDAALQFMVYQEVKKVVDHYHAEQGAALILNPDSGEILAMAIYRPGDNQENIQSEQVNIFVTDAYELGSVMKIFAACAALEEGVVQYDEEIDCEGKSTYIKKFLVTNWQSTGKIPFYQILPKSSNVGIAKIAHRLGVRLYDHLQKFGFGRRTGISFPGEVSGFISPPARWSASSLTVLSFGYEIMATLLQLGIATSVIATNGYAVKPHLLMNEIKQRENTNKERLYREKTMQQMKNILALIGERYAIPGYRVMGKTGTARRVKDGVYSDKNHLYTFAGIVEDPACTYRRVIITFMKESEDANLWAAQVAGPLFQRIAERMILAEHHGNWNTYMHHDEKQQE